LQKFDNYTGFEKNANFFRRKWQRLALRISKTKQKYSTLKNVIVSRKKSFETGWGVGAHQQLKTVVFAQKATLFDFRWEKTSISPVPRSWHFSLRWDF
jgi:hypothetical protein